jgi:glutathione S-transferase
MKVEVYLKLSKLPYRTVTGNPLFAPKSKLPYIEQTGGPTVADSSAILEHLESKQAHPLDEGVTELDRARARVIQRTLEEGLYFVILWSRWTEDAGWAVTRTGLDFLPFPIRGVMGRVIRKQNTQKTYAQGTGRHKPHEIYDIGKRDLSALATLLGEAPFFLGEKPRTIDVTAYAFLANVLNYEVESPLRTELRSRRNLVAFIERVRKRVEEASSSR